MDHPIEPVSREDSDRAGGAEQAFEALRAEVAALRRGIELVYRQAQEAKASAPAGAIPDCSLTLGQMQKSLQVIATRLEAVESKPALAMTPASLGTEIERVARETVNVVSRPFLDGMAQARGTVRELEDLIGQARERERQRAWLWSVGMIGGAAGIALWIMLIRVLPWDAGTWLASVPLAGGDRWQAGEMLMQKANRASWERMVRLYNACPQNNTTDLCEAAMAVRAIPPSRR